MTEDDHRPPDGRNLIHHPSVWLVSATLALLVGQAAAVPSWSAPTSAAYGLLAPVPLLLARRWRRWGALVILVGVAFALGYVRHRELLHPEFSSAHLRSVMTRHESLYLEGVLRQEPEKLPNRTRWLVRAEALWHPTGSEEVEGNLLISVRTVRRDWRYGDRVRLTIKPSLPRDSGNPGGFNYAAYLADREIYVTGYLDNDGEVQLVKRQVGGLRVTIESLRRDIRRFIQRQLSPENGPLLKALVVGDMGEIPKDVRNNFTAAGVNHVLSISGLHVSMLGLLVFALIRFGLGFNTYLLLRWNLLKLATFFSFFAVVFYTALAGAQVPTLRSAIMIGVYELAILLDREEEVMTSLTLAALLIALIWPGVISDISFQLSFLAVLFIAWGMRKAMEWVPKPEKDLLPQEKSWVKDYLRKIGLQFLVPLMATLGTGPLIAHYFGHLSLAGLISNPLIVPLTGFVVVPLGLLIGICAVVAPAAATPLVWLAERLTALTTWLVQVLANLPLANLSVPAPNLYEVALLYALFIAVLLLKTYRTAIVAVLLVLGVLGADVLYWRGERWQRRELRVTHLNVGQGDAAVIEFPGSKVLVLDAGGTAVGDFDTGESIVAPFLRSRKILKADYLMVSHARIDHYGGMRALVKEFSPEEFWSGPATSKLGRFEELDDAVERAGIKRIKLSSEAPCRIIEAVKLCTVYPGSDGGDDRSVVLRLEFGKASFLFAGDIDKRDERALQGNPKALRAAILKIPRHGSATASSDEFIGAVKPQLAVLSSSGRGPGAAKRDELLERYRQTGAQLLRTDEDGAIILKTNGESLQFETYKSGRRGTIDF
ncbi:MAG: DNA internalization-related competence protein ComEC/Rec2 [Deltaproteobacteria bacterium]|nr:DNA internalization-related competence protein ComEC/Rec2 [Deltaproteobacteria bacterium]